MPELSRLAMERILKKAGAKRVGKDATEELRKTLEEFGVEISSIAVKLAEHAKRKTVTAEDIRLALENWSPRFIK